MIVTIIIVIITILLPKDLRDVYLINRFYKVTINGAMEIALIKR